MIIKNVLSKFLLVSIFSFTTILCEELPIDRLVTSFSHMELRQDALVYSSNDALKFLNQIDMVTIDFYVIKDTTIRAAKNLAQSKNYLLDSTSKKSIKKILKAALTAEKLWKSMLENDLDFFSEDIPQNIKIGRKNLYKLYCDPKRIDTVKQALERIKAFYSVYDLFVNKYLLHAYTDRYPDF